MAAGSFSNMTKPFWSVRASLLGKTTPRNPRAHDRACVESVTSRKRSFARRFRNSSVASVTASALCHRLDGGTIGSPSACQPFAWTAHPLSCVQKILGCYKRTAKTKAIFWRVVMSVNQSKSTWKARAASTSVGATRKRALRKRISWRDSVSPTERIDLTQERHAVGRLGQSIFQRLEFGIVSPAKR